MSSLRDLAPDALYWVNEAVRYVDGWTGCRATGPSEDCRALHWTATQIIESPIWAFVAFAAYWVLRAAMPWLWERIIDARDRFFTDHKRARFMRAWEAYRAGMFWPRGFLLGDLARGMILVLRVAGDASILTFGGARTGKGVGVLITNCLLRRWQIVVDWGAETVAVCLPYWRAMGVKVVVVNPYRLFSDSPFNIPMHRLSAIGDLDPSKPGFGARCHARARAFFVTVAVANESFWTDGAIGIVDFALRQVIMTKGAAATLIDVYSAILGGLKNQEKLFKAMTESNDEFIKNAGNRLLQLLESKSRVYYSFIQHVETSLSWMADDCIAQTFSGNDLDLDDLRGKNLNIKGCVIAIILPVQFKNSHGAMVKIILEAIISSMVEEIPRNTVLLSIDESQSLGDFHWIEEGMALLGRYRIQIHAIYQHMKQARAAFGDKFDAMLSSAYVKNFIGFGDPETAKVVSEASGGVLSADELSRLEQGSQISFVRYQRPILIQSRPYFHRLLMRRLTGPNPYHAATPRLPPLYPLLLGKGFLVAVWAMSRPTPRQALFMALITGSYVYWRNSWSLF